MIEADRWEAGKARATLPRPIIGYAGVNCSQSGGVGHFGVVGQTGSAGADELASQDVLSNVDMPVVVIARGTMKIFDVLYDDDGGTLRRRRLIASGAIDPDGNQCELRKA